MARPGTDPVDIARRLIAVEPAFAPPYATLAGHYAKQGDLDQAESLLWKGLELWPGTHEFYSSLYAIRFDRNPNDPLGERLQQLSLWKLSLLDEVPEAVARGFEALPGEAGDPADPETYETLATVMELRLKDSPVAPGDERLMRPFVLLNDLQRNAPSIVARETMQDIIDHAAECLPVLRGALRQWARKQDGVSDKAGFLIVALLAEIGGPQEMEDFLELAAYENGFLHVHWAIHRLAERYPEAALAAFRAATPKAPVSLRCGLAEQMNMMPHLPGIEDAIVALVDHFSRLSRDRDAGHLLLAAVTALLKFNAEDRADAILARCRRMLPKKEQAWVKDTLESQEGFVPTLAGEALDGLGIEDVVLERVLMDDEREEDEEYDEDDFEDGEEEEDEDDVSLPTPGGAVRPPNLIPAIAEFTLRHFTEAEQERAKVLYFDVKGKVEIDRPEMEGFLQWMITDFRRPGSGLSALDHFLRTRGPQLNARERAFAESLRGARYGLWEVQEIEKGWGLRVKDLYTGEEPWVHDVNSSHALVRWDCLLTRVQDFEGEALFVGTGIVAPRNFLPQFQRWIEEESRAAGQTELEFVRANSHRLHRVVYEIQKKSIENLRVVNREGDPIEFSHANYQVLDEEALLAKLRALEKLREEPDREDPASCHFGWLETGAEDARTSYGHITIRDGGLRLECNSRKRLKRGRRLLETHASDYLKHLGDSFESVKSAMQRMDREKPAEPKSSIPPDVERELLSKVQSAHYTKWPDENLPALGGKTPRQAVKTEGGRKAVRDLIRLLENGEARRAASDKPAFDFTPLRRSLGLDEE